MTDKFENIESEEIKIKNNGEIELSDALTEAVAGGFDPEQDEEDEMKEISNGICGAGC